jgi:2-oxoglutarate dehydrogenase E1 component
VGTIKRHVEEQKSLLDSAFAAPAASPARDY